MPKLDEAHPLFERGWSSYTLKHGVENWLREEGRYRYIPQGAMILAALHKGLPVMSIPDDRGVYVESRELMSAKAKRILALLRDPRHRERLLHSLNQDNTDPANPVGGQEQGMKVLQEMNGLDQEHDQHIQEIGPKLTVY